MIYTISSKLQMPEKPSTNTSDIPQDTSNIQNTENEEINQPIIEDEILLAERI